MKLQLMSLFLMLLALSWPVSSIEPIYLGSGASDQVINLDSGAGQPSQNYNFGKTGFAAPSVPQTMALSSTVMLTEAQELRDEAEAARDEAVSARDEARIAYEQAQSLVSRVEETKRLMDDLAISVQSSSETCATSASRCMDILDLANETYARTLSISSAMERNMSRIESDLLDAKDYANASALSAAYVSDCLNQTRLAYNGTLVASRDCAAALNNITLLAREVQLNADYVRAWTSRNSS
jgi:hypothetical protein